MVILRYILKHLLYVTVFVTCVLTVLVMLTQSLRFLELIIETGAPPGIFFNLMALAIPRFLEVVLPLAIVTAVIFIYSKMTTENEMVILRAAGFDQKSLMMPALWLAVIGFVCMAFLTTWATPTSHNRLEVLRSGLKTEYASFLLREGVFNNIDDGTMIYVDERGAGGTLSGLVIHNAPDNGDSEVTIIADRGDITSTDEDTTELIVYNGTRQSLNSETGNLDVLQFEEYTLEIQNRRSVVNRRARGTDEYTMLELLFTDRTAKNPEFAKMVSAEIHRRIGAAISVFSFVFMALAALLYGSFNRRGQTRRILAAAGLVVILQSLFIALSNLMAETFAYVYAYYYIVMLPIVVSIYFISPSGERLRRRLFSRPVRPV